MVELLFTPFALGSLRLANRVVVLPLYLAYANPEGSVSGLVEEHYRELGASGAALVITEHVGVRADGLVPRMLRLDHDRYVPELARVARAIKEGGALAGAQINHLGRYAAVASPVSASDLPPTRPGGPPVRGLAKEELPEVVEAYAAAARRVREAGFDLVEIHGAMAYLLMQFLSPRTNRRQDEYGGPLENRARFPLEVLRAVRRAVGPDFPVGYRFLADEWLPDGFKPEEAVVFARMVAAEGVAYLSVMGGCYDSMALPEVAARSAQPAYMVDLAAAVKGAVPQVPVIAAGRLATPEIAGRVLAEQKADLVGLARVILADRDWVRKAQRGEPVVTCDPACHVCQKRVSRTLPAICPRWPRERQRKWRGLLREAE